MAVSEHDVRHVAALARLGLDEARVPALVDELNGILVHMDVLRGVKTDADAAVGGVGAGGMPLREDGGAQYPLAHPRSDVAPAMRAGFFLVPRLATHAGLRAGAGAEGAADAEDALDDVADSSVDDAVAADEMAQDEPGARA